MCKFVLVKNLVLVTQLSGDRLRMNVITTSKVGSIIVTWLKLMHLNLLWEVNLAPLGGRVVTLSHFMINPKSLCQSCLRRAANWHSFLEYLLDRLANPLA